MIVIFHAIFVVTRYVLQVLSQSVCRLRLKATGTDIVSGHRVVADVQSVAKFDVSGNPVFIPPVYVQRYLAVRCALEDERWRGRIRKVVDFGCAEFGLFPYLKSLPGLREVLTVDIDATVLDQYMCRAAPLASDYLGRRTEPLDVRILAGSISDPDDCLLGCDAVICVELLEHLYPHTLEDVPYTVFGFIQPMIAIFTTPNSEFNVVFPESKGFRHWDHKFEWTRDQFACWANNIVLRYPDYEVFLRDVGPGPPGTEAVGCCSQMALFVNKCAFSRPEDVPCPQWETRICGSVPSASAFQKYKLIRHYSFPYQTDTRSDESKICDEAVYQLHSLSSCDEYRKGGTIEIPLSAIMPVVRTWTSAPETVRKILENAGWRMVPHEEASKVAVLYPLWESDSDGDGDGDTWSPTCSVDDFTDSRVMEEESWVPDDGGAAGQSWHSLSFCPSRDFREEGDGAVREASDASSRTWPGNPSSCSCSTDLETLRENLGKSAVISLVPPSLHLVASADREAADSCSLDEANDKLGDSGYPNSGGSALDMNMDLTPEQVEEITESDALLRNSSDSHVTSGSLSDGDMTDSDSFGDDEEGRYYRPPPYVHHRPHDILPFGAAMMNVENGDVANNNRDGEGNNAVAQIPELVEMAAAVDRGHLEEHLIPLLEAAEDLDNDNQVHIPEHGEPFPHWLLNLLGLANHGGGDAANFGPGLLAEEEEEEAADDADRARGFVQGADEGIEEDLSTEDSSLNTDTAASEHGSDSDIEVLELDPVPGPGAPEGDMGGGGEPNMFRDVAG